MPGQGANSRMGAAARGGARGWRQQAKVSMTIMCPPPARRFRCALPADDLGVAGILTLTNNPGHLVGADQAREWYPYSNYLCYFVYATWA